MFYQSGSLLGCKNYQRWSTVLLLLEQNLKKELNGGNMRKWSIVALTIILMAIGGAVLV